MFEYTLNTHLHIYQQLSYVVSLNKGIVSGKCGLEAKRTMWRED